jgi:DNA-binding response OmpR family regulator
MKTITTMPNQETQAHGIGCIPNIHEPSQKTGSEITETDNPFEFLGAHITPCWRKIKFPNGKTARLTIKELNILTQFHQNPGIICTHEKITHAAWGRHTKAKPKKIAIRIWHLKKLFRANGLNLDKNLRSLRGTGYLFKPQKTGANTTNMHHNQPKAVIKTGRETTLDAEPFKILGAHITPQRKEIKFPNGATDRLAPIKLKILMHLNRKPGMLCTYEEIAQTLWGFHTKAKTKKINELINQIIRKFHANGLKLGTLCQIQGIGYVFRPDTPAPTGTPKPPDTASKTNKDTPAENENTLLKKHPGTNPKTEHIWMQNLTNRNTLQPKPAPVWKNPNPAWKHPPSPNNPKPTENIRFNWLKKIKQALWNLLKKSPEKPKEPEPHTMKTDNIEKAINALETAKNELERLIQLANLQTTLNLLNRAKCLLLEDHAAKTKPPQQTADAASANARNEANDIAKAMDTRDKVETAPLPTHLGDIMLKNDAHPASPTPPHTTKSK